MSDTIDIAIAATGRHGDGIANWNGQTLFVPGAIAGDVVSIATPSPSDKPSTVKLLNLVTPSPDRVVPPCVHFPTCGGCKTQHIGMAAYTAWKQNFVLTALAENGLTPTAVDTPQISPPHSRRRATFAVQRQGKDIHIGFNQAKSHDLIDLTMCEVLRPEIVALLPGLRLGMRAYLGDAQECDLRVTYLDNGCDLVIIGGNKPGRREREILAAVAHDLNLLRICWRKTERGADDVIIELTPPRVAFRHGVVAFPPGGFLQATLEGETALANAVTTAIGKHAPVADLFCGLGTFALSLTPRQLTVVDADGAAIQSLRDALRARSQAQVSCRDLVREPLITSELEPFKAVIFDPPRDGAKAQATQLAASTVRVIAAVSCDLNSFCRDGKILQAGGYRLTRLTIVDQFLWSTHVELVGVFQRKA